MDLVREYVPSDAEVPADHWSKSVDYLVEKAKREPFASSQAPAGSVAPFNKIDPKTNKLYTTHALAASAFETAYVMTEADIKAKEAREAWESRSTKATLPATESELEEMAKAILDKVTAELEKAELAAKVV